ncbi:MAG: hypothetical protein KJT03_16810, partial [Verrucomicrobiae bacterium]|nr:hypothetical protein [Verrucomicrobiae bacterium]
VTEVRDPANRVTRFTYDATGTLESITDPDGSKRTFFYQNPDYKYLLTKEVHKRGNAGNDPLPSASFDEFFVYDDFGRIKSGTRIDERSFSLEPAQSYGMFDPDLTADPDEAPEIRLLAETTDAENVEAVAKFVNTRGEEIIFGLSPFGQFVRQKDSEGHEVSSVRNERGLVVTDKDEEGNEVTYVYDNFNNLIERTDAIATETWEYDPEHFNSLISHTDGENRKTTYEINEQNGDVLSITITQGGAPAGNPSEAKTSYSYFTNGLLKSSTDAVGNSTQFEYDRYGRLTKRTNPDGSTFTQSYNDLTGNIHVIVDEDSHRTELKYDPMNRTTERRVPSKEGDEAVTYLWKNDYDAAGNVVKITDSNKNVQTFEYDPLDRVTKRVDGAGVLNLVTEFGYERSDSRFSPPYSVPEVKYGYYYYEKDPRGGISVQVSNRKGKVEYEIDALGRVTQTLYDKAERPVGIKLPNGGKITYVPDARGRIRSQTGPTTESIIFDYDNVNRLKKKTVHNNGVAQETIFVYNLHDQVAELTDAEKVVTRNEYDAAGNLLKSTLGFGSATPYVTEYTYNNRNFVETRKEQDKATTTYTYTKTGMVETVTDPRGAAYKTTYGYDGMNRLVSITNPENEIILSIFDGEGNLKALIDPRGEGDPTNEDYRTAFEYDQVNRLVKKTDPLGGVTRMEYDDNGNTSDVYDPRSLQPGGAGKYHTHFEYDLVNRLIKEIDAEDGITLYEYDDLDKLTLITDPRAEGSKN